MPDPDEIPYVNMVKNATTPDEIRAIPIIGDLYGTANSIIDFAEYGCFPNWTIWVDNLFPALGNMILQILDFGTGDVLRGYFRPSNLRGASTLTRAPVRGRPIKTARRGGRIIRPGIPEIGNSIGKKLPGAQFFAARKVSGLERRFWMVDFAVQRVLFYWLIADVTEDFVTNWTTAIMESEACAKEQLGDISAEISDLSPTFEDTWGGLIGWTTITDTTPGLWNALSGTISVPAGYKAIIAMTGEGYGVIGDATNTQLRATSLNVPQDEGGATPLSVTPPDLPNQPQLYATNFHFGNTNLSFRIQGTGVLMGIRNVTMQAIIVDENS